MTDIIKATIAVAVDDNGGVASSPVWSAQDRWDLAAELLQELQDDDVQPRRIVIHFLELEVDVPSMTLI